MSRSIDTDAAEVADPAEDDVLTAEKAPEKPEKALVNADDGIEGLKQQLQAEKSRREELERRAQAAEAEVYKAKTEVEDTNLHLISNAIETLKANTASLEDAYANAMASGDYKRAARIQVDMSTNAAKLLQLENGKQAMSERPKAPPPASDPVEALARQLTPRSAAWVRAHPECATDNRLYQKMLAAHNLTVADGVAPDTDEYFAAVEGILGFNKRSAPAAVEDDEDGTTMAAKATARRSSPAAAPVSRSGSPSSTSNPRAIRLSAEEREIARLSNLTDQQYWEQQQRIKRDSRAY